MEIQDANIPKFASRLQDNPHKPVNEAEHNNSESELSDSESGSLLIDSPSHSSVSSEKDISNSESEKCSYNQMRRKDPCVRKLYINTKEERGNSLENQTSGCEESNERFDHHSSSLSDQQVIRAKNSLGRHMFAHSNRVIKRRSVSDTECATPVQRSYDRTYSEDAKDLADIHSILKVATTTPFFMHFTDASETSLRHKKLRGEFPCRLCTLVFPNLRALKGHSKSHMQLSPYGCSLCSYTSSDKSTMMRHLRTHNGERPFQCAVCHFAFTTKANCERHLRNRHGKCTREDIRTNLILVMKSLPSESKLRSHTKSSEIIRPFRCPVCKQRFSTRNNVARHALRRHPTSCGNKLVEAPTNSCPNTDFRKLVEAPTNSCPNTDFRKLVDEQLIVSSRASSCLSSESSVISSSLEIVERVDSGYQSQLKINDLEYQEEPLDLTTTTDPLDLSLCRKREKSHFVAENNPKLFVKVEPSSDLHNFNSNSSHSSLFASPFISNPNRNFYEISALKFNESSSIHNQLSTFYGEKSAIKEEYQQKISARCPSSGGSHDSSKENSPALLHPISSTPVDINKNRPKQRRYRTERPFACLYCTAKFTLRSNMDRHIKQQHPQYWQQRPRGGRRNPLIPSGQVDSVIDNQSTETAQISHDMTNESKSVEKRNSPDIKLVNVCKLKTETAHDHFTNINSSLEEISESFIVHKKQEEKRNADFSSVSCIIDNTNLGPDFRKFLGENIDDTDCIESGHESLGDNVISSEQRRRSAYSSAPHRVSCPFCLRQFPWTSSLRRHILTHTGQKPYKCPQCPLWFTTKSNCERHLTRKHIACFNAHSHSPHHFEEQYSQCDDSSVSSAAVDNVLDDKPSLILEDNGGENDTEEPDENADSECLLLCRKCGQCFPSLDSLNQHVESQHVDLPFKCYLCDSSHAERNQILEHLRENHAKEYDILLSKGALAEKEPSPEPNDLNDSSKFPCYVNRKVTCALCLRRFWSAEDLRRHMRTHTGERPFSCDICNRRFTLKHSMLRHKKKHLSKSCEDEKVSGNEEDGSFDGEEEEEDLMNNETISSVSEIKTQKAVDANDSDLIGDLLGIKSALVDEVLISKSANDAAKLLGVKNE